MGEWVSVGLSGPHWVSVGLGRSQWVVDVGFCIEPSVHLVCAYVYMVPACTWFLPVPDHGTIPLA